MELAAFISKWGVTNFPSDGLRSITGAKMREFKDDISTTFLANISVNSVDTTGADITVDMVDLVSAGFIGSDEIDGNKNIIIDNQDNAVEIKFFHFSVDAAGRTLTFEAATRHIDFDGNWSSETGLVWTSPKAGGYILKAEKVNSLWFVRIYGAFVNP